MNAINFYSAYKQLEPHERAFVDAFINDCEKSARKNELSLIEYLTHFDPSTVPYSQSRLLERQIIRAAVSERVQQIAAIGELSIDRWIKEVANIAFSNLGDYMTEKEENPSLDLSKCTPEQWAAIGAYDYELTKFGPKIKIKLHDKLKALEMYGKYVGAIVDNSKSIDTVLPVGITEQNAADIYARLIEHE